MLRILHVLPDHPYPPTHGGRVDNLSRLRALRALGHEVHVVVTTKVPPAGEEHEALAALANRVTYVQRHRNWLSVLPGVPLQICCRRGLSRFKPPHPYDLLLLEQEYVSPLLLAEGLEFDRAVLRVHNDEAAYFRDLSASEPATWRRAYYTAESRAFRVVTPYIHNRADALWFISDEECQEWESGDGRARAARRPSAHWLPAGTASSYRPLTPPGERVLFAGNLFQPTNLDALRWYMAEVHPRLAGKGGYEFWVAGRTKSGVGEPVLSAVLRSDCTRIFADPPDLDPIYQECSVFVNPMRRGAGVKLKSLEAIQNGLPLVSTETGIRGTGLRPGEDVLVAGDPAAFAAHIEDLLSSTARRTAIHQSAAAFIRCRYNQVQNLDQLLTHLFRDARHPIRRSHSGSLTHEELLPDPTN